MRAHGDNGADPDEGSTFPVTSSAKEMEAFDGLPVRLRNYLNFTPVAFSSLQCKQTLQQNYTPEELIQFMERLIRDHSRKIR